MSNKTLPADFCNRIFAQIPEEAAELVAALDTPPPVSIRINPQKLQNYAAGIPMLWHQEGYYLLERPSFTIDPLFHAGAYYVQEASSMVIVNFLETEKYEKILDLCAAPGGKSTLLAAAMQQDTVLISNEVIRARAGILSENMTKWGSTNVIVTNNDPRHFGALQSYFDLILIDAPCSGEGMFRKDLDSRNEWSLENVDMCAARQMRIVADVIPALAAGGHIIYSTCTFSTAENEELIEQILQEFPEMELSPVFLEEKWGLVPSKINDVENAAYRCYPHKLQGEGFFVCRLQKKGIKPEKEEVFISAKNARNQQNSSKKDAKKTPFPEKEMKRFLREYAVENIEMYEDNLFYLTPQVKETLKDLARFHFVKKGILIGKIQGKDFNPAHEWALCPEVATDLPVIDLELAQALDYLRKNDLPNDTEHINGWALARYEEVNLGWIKVTPQRLKNHFPVNWRIKHL